MAGIFSKFNRPIRSGSYTNFVAQAAKAVPVPLQGVVALPIVHDWGPQEEVVTVSSLPEFQQVFGRSNTDGARAVEQAFKGESVDGIGGASQVKVYRAASSAVDTADRAISNTTPAVAITITAIYSGSYGNDLKTQVVADADAPTTTHNLIISDAVGELERYVYLKTDIADLVSQVNLLSDWVSATQSITGVALGIDGSAVALSGGNDGSTLVSGDWSDVRDAFESERFSIFAPWALTDTSLHAAFNTWVTDLNEKGKRFLAVFGASDVDAAQAITDAATFNNSDVALYGGGTVEDDSLADDNGDLIQLTPSLFAPRVAGIIAARGEAASISFARLGDVTVVAGPTDSNIEDLIERGVVTFGQDSDARAPVRLEQGVTTYTDDSSAKPLNQYGVIKVVRIMHGIELDFADYQQTFVIGKLPVDDDSRETLVAAMLKILQVRVDAHIIHDEPVAMVDQSPPPSDTDDFIQIRYELVPTRATEKVFNTIYVG